MRPPFLSVAVELAARELVHHRPGPAGRFIELALVELVELGQSRG